MSAFNVLLAGVGGQGIVFMSRVLMQTALLRGAPARGAETHGMAQRGGSVVAHVRFGACRSPLVIPGTGHLLLALDCREGIRSLKFLRPQGLFLANSPGPGPLAELTDDALRGLLARNRITVRTLDAARIAAGLGNPMAVNLIMAGFAAALPAIPFTLEDLRRAIPLVARSHHLAMIDAAEAGHRAAESEAD